MKARSGRCAAAVGLFVAVALGLASRTFHLGWPLWDKSVGDVAYAVMVGFLVMLARPQLRACVAAALAVAVCFVIELVQLSGVLARAPRLARVALGDTFAWHDVACYVVGGLLFSFVVGAHARIRGPKKASG